MQVFKTAYAWFIDFYLEYHNITVLPVLKFIFGLQQNIMYLKAYNVLSPILDTACQDAISRKVSRLTVTLRR